MKPRDYTVTGRTNAKGQLLIADQKAMAEFFSKWPNVKFTGRFHVAQPGTSEALKGYYFNKIVPDFRRALWEAGERKTEKDTEKFIRELSPIMWEETPDPETGKYEHELLEINDLDNQQLVLFIEHLKQIAAEEFYFFIEDPATYTK
jgi:hypothetical protein